MHPAPGSQFDAGVSHELGPAGVREDCRRHGDTDAPTAVGSGGECSWKGELEGVRRPLETLSRMQEEEAAEDWGRDEKSWFELCQVVVLCIFTK